MSQQQVQQLIQLYSSGNFQPALQLALKLIKLQPRLSVAHTIAGACYNSTGNPQQAISYFDTAVSIEPNNPNVRFGLANALRLSNQPAKAIHQYQKLLSVQPNHVHALYFLGVSQFQMGQIEESVHSLTSAIQLNPDFAEAHFSLAYSLWQLGKLDNAKKHLLTTIKLLPNHVYAHNLLGSLSKELADTESAETHYKKAIDINPNFAEALNNLGNLYNELGDSKLAQINYQKAVDINPNYAKAHSNLAAVKTYEGEDEQFKDMIRLSLDANVPAHEKTHLCFAIGKAYDDLGNTNDSFKYYEQGNGQRKQELGYSIQRDEKLFETIKKNFENDSIKVTSTYKNETSNTPIFIVGMPRSGTSLTEHILACHSQVHGAGELEYLEQFLTPLINQKIVNSKNNESYLVTSDDLHNCLNAYFNQLTTLNSTKPFITDKMPLNFRWIGFILQALPNAKIIHIQRDPIATCWSNFKLYFQSKDLGFTNNLKDLAHYYNLYSDLMTFWNQIFPGQIYNLNYESLTQNSEEEIRKLLEYCQLPWEDSCLDFAQTKRQIKTASANQVRKGIYQGSSQTWKKYEAHISSLIEAIKV